MRLDETRWSCDFCLEPREPGELDRIRSDVINWRDKRPTVHADICKLCQDIVPVSALMEVLHDRLFAREQEKKSREKGTER